MANCNKENNLNNDNNNATRRCPRAQYIEALINNRNTVEVGCTKTPSSTNDADTISTTVKIISWIFTMFIIGIYFISCFWLNVAKYLIKFWMSLLQAERTIKLSFLLFFVILVASLILRGICGRRMLKANLEAKCLQMKKEDPCKTYETFKKKFPDDSLVKTNNKVCNKGLKTKTEKPPEKPPAKPPAKLPAKPPAKLPAKPPAKLPAIASVSKKKKDNIVKTAKLKNKRQVIKKKAPKKNSKQNIHNNSNFIYRILGFFFIQNKKPAPPIKNKKNYIKIDKNPKKKVITEFKKNDSNKKLNVNVRKVAKAEPVVKPPVVTVEENNINLIKNTPPTNEKIIVLCPKNNKFAEKIIRKNKKAMDKKEIDKKVNAKYDISQIDTKTLKELLTDPHSLIVFIVYNSNFFSDLMNINILPTLVRRASGLLIN